MIIIVSQFLPLGMLFVLKQLQLESVAAFLAGHHAGDTGPGGSAKGPCAIAGMFGCSPAAASEEYGEVNPFLDMFQIYVLNALLFACSRGTPPMMLALPRGRPPSHRKAASLETCTALSSSAFCRIVILCAHPQLPSLGLSAPVP